MRLWLKEKRLSKKYSQYCVANKAGISRSYYTHIENGTKTPTVGVAKSLGKVLDFDWTKIFDDHSSQKERSA